MYQAFHRLQVSTVFSSRRYCKAANRLQYEKSPYLLQHKHNPVDWWPWNEKVFEQAKEQDKPIFLSIGYSTCHWCHVMERECFEDEKIAKQMNDLFFNIKVDREERPDIDKTFMTFIQQLGVGGGWPISVWLTPSKLPIWGGTYYPPRDKYGRPGFPTVLDKISSLYKEKKNELEEQGNNFIHELNQTTTSTIISGKLNDFDEIQNLCYQQIIKRYDGKQFLFFFFSFW